MQVVGPYPSHFPTFSQTHQSMEMTTKTISKQNLEDMLYIHRVTFFPVKYVLFWWAQDYVSFHDVSWDEEYIIFIILIK